MILDPVHGRRLFPPFNQGQTVSGSRLYSTHHSSQNSKSLLFSSSGIFNASAYAGHGPEKPWVFQVLENVKVYLDNLFNNTLLPKLDKMSFWMENKLEAFSRWWNPVSVPQLRSALEPLLAQPGAQFPLAMVRARMIEESENSFIRPHASRLFMSYGELQKQVGEKKQKSRQLLANTVNSESSAYLTSHLIALEAAIRNTSRRFIVDTGRLPQTLRVGIEDAQAVVARRIGELQYVPNRKLISNPLYDLILESPKVALHEHYRGSAPMAMVRSWFIKQKQAIAYKSNDTIQEHVRVDRLFAPNGSGPVYQPSLDRYRDKNDRLVAASIHSAQTAYLGAYMYTLKSGLENVRYFEYRLNPMSQFVKDPLIYTQAIQTGLDDAKAFLKNATGKDIDSNLIFSADRQPKPGRETESPVKAAMAIVDLAIAARAQGIRVTGFDIQGSERYYDIRPFKPVADKLKAYNREVYDKFKSGKLTEDLRIGADIHAGEVTVSGEPLPSKTPTNANSQTRDTGDNSILGEESIRRTVELFLDPNPDPKARNSSDPSIRNITPVRIGHGIEILHDTNLIDFCRDNLVGLVQCPRSNVQTGAVSYYDKLHTVALSRPKKEGGYGLLVSTSCDNRMTSKTNSCNELVKLTRYRRAKHSDRKRMQMNGIQTAFIFNPAVKRHMTQSMMTRYQELEKRPVFQQVIQKERNPRAFLKLLQGIQKPGS